MSCLLYGQNFMKQKTKPADSKKKLSTSLVTTQHKNLSRIIPGENHHYVDIIVRISAPTTPLRRTIIYS